METCAFLLPFVVAASVSSSGRSWFDAAAAAVPFALGEDEGGGAGLGRMEDGESNEERSGVDEEEEGGEEANL